MSSNSPNDIRVRPTGATETASESKQESDPSEAVHGKRMAPWVTLTEDGKSTVLKSHKAQWSQHRVSPDPASELEFLHLLESDESLRDQWVGNRIPRGNLDWMLDQWIQSGRPHPVKWRHGLLRGEYVGLEQPVAYLWGAWEWFLNERQSGGTASPESPSAETEERMSGCSLTPCSASSFVEMLVLAESIKPPFTLRVSKSDSATGAWFAVETPSFEMAAISLTVLVARLGAECGDTLAASLRGDPPHSLQQLTPTTRRLIHTIREQPQETQQQVLEMLDHLGN